MEGHPHKSLEDSAGLLLKLMGVVGNSNAHALGTAPIHFFWQTVQMDHP